MAHTTDRTTPLTRQRILKEALRLLDRQGLDALTMRRLAGELGVEAMSLYRYVRNKEDLLDGVVEVLLGDVQLADATSPTGASLGWQAVLQELAHGYRRVLLAHPAALPVVATRPVNTPAAFAALEAALAVLDAVGFPADRALYVLDCLGAYVIGHAFIEAGRLSKVEPLAAPLPARMATRAAPVREYPHIVLMADTVNQRNPDEEFEYGLQALLRGFWAAANSQSDEALTDESR